MRDRDIIGRSAIRDWRGLGIVGIGLGQVLHGDGHVRERKAGSRIISDNITGTIVPWDISIHTSMGGFLGGNSRNDVHRELGLAVELGLELILGLDLDFSLDFLELHGLMKASMTPDNGAEIPDLS